jgi:hypothetical protein
MDECLRPGPHIPLLVGTCPPCRAPCVCCVSFLKERVGGGGAGAALGVLWAGGFGAVAFNVYKLQNGEE